MATVLGRWCRVLAGAVPVVGLLLAVTGAGPAAADSGGSGSEPVTVTVPSGTLTLTAAGRPVDLGTARLDPARELFLAGPARMPDETVTDTRADGLGWNVSGQVSDLTADRGGDRISAQDLGWEPLVVSAPAGVTVTAGPVVAPAPGSAPTDPGTAGLRGTRLLASAAAGAGPGTAVVSAVLTLRAPLRTRPAAYGAVLTLTAI